jgi:hypothetical protein
LKRGKDKRPIREEVEGKAEEPKKKEYSNKPLGKDRHTGIMATLILSGQPYVNWELMS